MAHTWTKWNPPDDRQFVSAEAGGARLRCDLRDELSRVLFYRGWVDRDLEGWMTAWLRPGDVYVDVGAHIGYLSALAARAVGPSGQVFAYEPAPDTFAKLQGAFDRGRFPQVRSVQAAMGDVEGERVLFAAAGPWSHQAYRNSFHPAEGLEASAAVNVRTLDGEHHDHRVRLLKIDVEGGELSVLAGATRLLGEHRCDALVVELNPPALARAGSDVVSLVDLLEGYGYRAHRLRGEGAPPRWDPVVVDGEFADALFLPD